MNIEEDHMPIQKLKNGKYRVRINLVIARGIYKRLSKTVSTYEEAKIVEKELVAQKICNGNVLFKNFYDIYIEDYKQRYKEMSCIRIDYIVKRNILPYFSEYKLCDITPSSIHSWQYRMASQNISGRTMHNFEAIFETMMNYAVKFFNLSTNPFKNIQKIGKVSAREMNFWTIDEFKKVLSVLSTETISDEAFKVILLISFFCGTRIGETLALTRKDIDFEQNILHITKTYKKFNGKEYITEPKTRNSVRNIVMPKFLTQILSSFVTQISKDENRIFSVISEYVIRKRIHKYAGIAGVKDIRVHDLRHSAISYLIHLGVPIYDISRRSGHVSPKITYRIYSHLYPEQQSHIAEVLEKAHDDGK